MGKLLSCSVADVPPLHLNSRNDMSRPYAIRITASTRSQSLVCISLIPTIVFPISVLHTKSFGKSARV
jgi:hypothetical protein